VSQGWQLKNIYLYLVSFVTLMMILFGLIAFANNVARFLFPADYLYYQTLMDIEREYTSTGRESPPLTELERIKDERMESERTRNRAYTLRDMIGTLSVWLIPLPFYFYHWRKIKEDILTHEGGIAE